MKKFNSGKTTFFNIFDIIYCDFIKKYSCGILSYKEEETVFPNIIKLSFYGDGLLHCSFFHK